MTRRSFHQVTHIEYGHNFFAFFVASAGQIQAREKTRSRTYNVWNYVAPEVAWQAAGKVTAALRKSGSEWNWRYAPREILRRRHRRGAMNRRAQAI